mmetsp:Transcript_11285/g.20400  ORF Transcript_11285/g.20400 Transcript_11285/m.20400 type:complete len:474 (-) Transcript_11285:861-2282(-)
MSFDWMGDQEGMKKFETYSDWDWNTKAIEFLNCHGESMDADVAAQSQQSTLMANILRPHSSLTLAQLHKLQELYSLILTRSTLSHSLHSFLNMCRNSSPISSGSFHSVDSLFPSHGLLPSHSYAFIGHSSTAKTQLCLSYLSSILYRSLNPHDQPRHFSKTRGIYYALSAESLSTLTERFHQIFQTKYNQNIPSNHIQIESPNTAISIGAVQFVNIPSYSELLVELSSLYEELDEKIDGNALFNVENECADWIVVVIDGVGSDLMRWHYGREVVEGVELMLKREILKLVSIESQCVGVTVVLTMPSVSGKVSVYLDRSDRLLQMNRFCGAVGNGFLLKREIQWSDEKEMFTMTSMDGEKRSVAFVVREDGVRDYGDTEIESQEAAARLYLHSMTQVERDEGDDEEHDDEGEIGDEELIKIVQQYEQRNAERDETGGVEEEEEGSKSSNDSDLGFVRALDAFEEERRRGDTQEE